MNRSRMDESHENSAPEQPSRATAPTSQTKETLERRASGLPRAHGKNNLFDRDQPLDISDDSDDELPTTITTRKKGPIGHTLPINERATPLLRQSQAEVDTDYFSEAWLSPGPAASLEPLVEHAYERAQFERQPSTSYVIPREDNVTTFDLWENDAQGNPQRKDSLHTTPIGHTNNDQSKALNRLYDQIRDMWRDLGNERKHSDQLGEQLLARDKVIENLHSKDQETQDILEGYKGDVADTQAVLKNCQDQLQSSVATVARLTEELRDARGSAHEDYQQAQNQAENLAARKSAYKDKYRQEHDAHRATLENMKKLQAKLKQATAKVSRSARRGHTGPSPPDSSDSEGDDANSPLPALSRQEYDHRRHPRPKKPEPEAFSEFASETKKLSYIRQKTKDKAFGCLQHGYLEPGAEFAHSNEAWSILDSVYKSLNTSIEAQSWYESLNSTMKPTESMAGRLFDSYPEVQDALEKAIANNGVPVGEPARPKVKGAAASVTSTSPQPSEMLSPWRQSPQGPPGMRSHPTPPPIDVAFISSRVAAAAVCHDQDICITSYDEIGRIAELSDKEWEDTQHLRAAGAKVLPEDYEKFRDKMERPHMTRQEILKRLPKTILGSNRWGGSYAAVRLAGSGEGASLSTSTMLVGSRRSPLDDVLLELCLSDPRLRDVKTALASNDRRIPHYLIAEGIRMELADLEASNDGKLFIGNGRLVVPFSEKLRTRIIAHIHNSLPGGHGGRTTTYQQDDALPGQPRPGDAAPPEVHLGNDGVTEYVVSQVLDSRIRRNLVDPHTGERGLLQYKVEWVGDDQSEPWQPYHNLRSCKESVQDFHSRNPGRPGPHATFHDYDDDGQLAIALLQLLDSKYSNKFAPQSEL
ncbi:Chromo domain containing protein [Pyrenophora tritici-repentis]|nr:Chromo domain containing protein [Pyrenophora tritici-repentis]